MFRTYLSKRKAVWKRSLLVALIAYVVAQVLMYIISQSIALLGGLLIAYFAFELSFFYFHNDEQTSHHIRL
ncbi:hypothetical protein [Thalassobacillus sp. CUG 92003]|uniref:hypothetical protein n=1 Tax=Thalassobacillus sp. CUG 92003 TaxID=2736641 RepID=UPI0015E73E58|nr:hypothetical protein [Thalassobacillus sp. CUG 92003]